MSLAFTATGLTIQTYQEIFDELVAAYQAIYGADINVNPDTPDGQRIGIEAKARLDIQEFCLALYNQFDPDLSSGEMLNKIIKLAGIVRRPATRSQVDVTITTDRALTLPSGYSVEDDLGQVWITTEAATLVLGANTVTLVAQDFGAVEASIGTVTSPVTIVLGVLSVTNAAAATVGTDEETDGELRIRRNRSLENPATSTAGGLFSVLGNLAGVTDLVIYENDQDTNDVVRNITPHTIWAVVEGGTVADIAEAFAKNKTGGTVLKGVTIGSYVETLTKPDGTTFTITHNFAFDRPTEVPLYIHLTVEGIGGATVNTALITELLAAKEYSIAEVAAASGLYATVYAAGTDFVATLLEISIDDISYTAGSITPGFDEVFTIDPLNITITDTTPP